MTVDLGDLVEVLQREVSPPGTNLFPNATDDEFLGNLQDAFWEAKLFNFFGLYVEADGVVSASSGGSDMSRTDQQLIVLFAGARILRNGLRNINTAFKASAGSVSYEVQKSAQLLRDLLADIRSRIDYHIQSVGATQTYYIDAITGRADSIQNSGRINWTSGSGIGSTYGGDYGW